MARKSTANKRPQGDPHPSAAYNNGWLRLSGAILKRASDEARAGDLGACDWLGSETSLLMADLLGIDTRAVERLAATWQRHPAGRIVIRMIGGTNG